MASQADGSMKELLTAKDPHVGRRTESSCVLPSNFSRTSAQTLKFLAVDLSGTRLGMNFRQFFHTCFSREFKNYTQKTDQDVLSRWRA